MSLWNYYYEASGFGSAFTAAVAALNPTAHWRLSETSAAIIAANWHLSGVQLKAEATY